MPDWTTSESDVTDIASDSNGNAYTVDQNFVTDTTTVSSYDTTGSQRWSVDIDMFTGYTVTASAGGVYVAGTDGSSDSTATIDLAKLSKSSGSVQATSSEPGSFEIAHAFIEGSSSEWYGDSEGVWHDFNSNASVTLGGVDIVDAVFGGTYAWVVDTDDTIYQVDETPTIIDSVNLTGSITQITQSSSHLYVDSGNTVKKISKSDLSITWENDFGDPPSDVSYDSNNSRIYTTFSNGSNRNPLQLRDSDGLAEEEYLLSDDQELVTVNQGTTSVFYDTANGDLYQVGDDEWEQRLVEATQFTATATTNSTNFVYQAIAEATMNTAQVTSAQVSSSQVVGQANMNLLAGASALDVDANPATVTASMNNVAKTEEFDATQVNTVAAVLDADARERTATWLIEDDDGVEYKIDGFRLGDGVPQFRRSRELTRTLIFNDDEYRDHTDSYLAIRDKFNSYLSDETIKVVATYDGKPHYTQNIHPRSETNSYLWKVTPNSAISGVEPWWVVVTNIEDTTRQIGEGEALDVTMYVIAPTSEGDRTYIEDNFEV